MSFSAAIFYFDNYKPFSLINNLSIYQIIRSNLAKVRYIKEFYNVVYCADRYVVKELNKTNLDNLIKLEAPVDNPDDLIRDLDEKLEFINYLFIKPYFPLLQAESVENGFHIIDKNRSINRVYFGRLVKTFHDINKKTVVMPVVLDNIFIINHNLLYNSNQENSFLVEVSLPESLDISKPEEYELCTCVLSDHNKKPRRTYGK